MKKWPWQRIPPWCRAVGRWLLDQRETVRQKVVDRMRWQRYRSELPFLRQLRFGSISFSTRGAIVLGASLERCIRIIKRHARIRGKSVLIIGCGKGEEIHRWVKEAPSRILGMDYLDYRRHWQSISYPNVQVIQADIREFDTDERFDLVTSKAVLEHIDGLESVFGRLVAPLRVGGHFWADFGPLYHTWGGAHAPLAYDHLLLHADQYAKKLDDTHHDEGKLFWKHNLFSRLTYQQYIDLFDRYLEGRYLAVQISDEALAFRNAHRATFDQLAARYGEQDLLVKSLFYLGQKTRDSGDTLNAVRDGCCGQAQNSGQGGIRQGASESAEGRGGRAENEDMD